MLEGKDALDGDLAVGRFVEGCDDDAIRAITESVKDLVVVTYRMT